MIPIVNEKREEVEALCRRWRVSRLDVFGSATRGTFDVETSDLDFLVEFLPLPRGERAEAYFGLLEDLEALFSRPVDLVMARAISNPYFRRAVDETRELLYAA